MNSKFLILSLFLTIGTLTMFAQKSEQGSSGSGGGVNIIQQSETRSTSRLFTTQIQILDNTDQEIACIDSEQFQYYAQLLAPGTYTVIYNNKEGYIIARTEFFVEE